MKVTVFGGTGRICCLVVDHLAARGHQVCVVSRHAPEGGESSNVPGVSYHEGSIADLGHVEQCIQDADYVLTSLMRGVSRSNCRLEHGT